MLLIRPATDDEWLAMVKPSGRIRPGERIRLARGESEGDAEAIVGEATAEGLRSVQFDGGDVGAILDEYGHVPLPPYIKRADTRIDQDRYQTVYARVAGAVAAPTAGLHFTPEILSRLEEKGAGIAKLLLHVGPGTFRAVRDEDLQTGKLDAEWCEISEETATRVRETRAAGGRVIAVGTTTTRALEAAALAGQGELRAYRGFVDLFIYPPFEYRVVDALVTNFHLPQTSLLLLVSALAGREMILRTYREAVERGYRFYSYGDAMFLS